MLLQTGETKNEAPTPEDVARAFDGPRDDDWSITLTRDNGDDYMDAMIDQGELWLECEIDDEFLQAISHVDDATAKAMFASFYEGGDGWRDMALWKDPAPEPGEPKKKPEIPIPVIAGGIAGLLFLITVFFLRGGWIVVLFALAFPGLIATAALNAMQKVKRAKSWTKSTGRILTSGLAAETINGKEVQVPRVEYEFPVGMSLHKVRGRTVSLAETVGPHGAAAILKRYTAGASVPVYYDPDDPHKSVLERDLPEKFQLVWVAVAVMVAVIFAGAWWFLLR
jgi:hypothetical protein